MRDIVLHILILLQLFFREGEEPVARICEMHTFIGTDEKWTSYFLFHLAQPVRQRRLCHEQPLCYLIDTPLFAQIDEDFPIRVIHSITSRNLYHYHKKDFGIELFY